MQTIDRIPLQPITNTYSSYAVWRIFCSQPTTNKWRDTVSEHSFSYSSSALRIVALAGALGWQLAAVVAMIQVVAAGRGR